MWLHNHPRLLCRIFVRSIDMAGSRGWDILLSLRGASVTRQKDQRENRNVLYNIYSLYYRHKIGNIYLWAWIYGYNDHKGRIMLYIFFAVFSCIVCKGTLISPYFIFLYICKLFRVQLEEQTALSLSSTTSCSAVTFVTMLSVHLGWYTFLPVPICCFPENHKKTLACGLSHFLFRCNRF